MEEYDSHRLTPFPTFGEFDDAYRDCIEIMAI